MDILRRNTDYALRAMVHLATHYQNELVSARTLATKEALSYQLACKLMQKLHKAGLVESAMGPKGGFRLSREPSKINLFEIVEVIQGPVSLSKCLLRRGACQRKRYCKISKKLGQLQQEIDDFFSGITLGELLQGKNAKSKAVRKTSKRKNR